jgi:hypothetical protein
VTAENDDKYREQIRFLLEDKNTARAEKDSDGAMFALFQIVKLSEKYNATQPPPSPERIQWFCDLLEELNTTPEEVQMVLDFLKQRYGEKP